MEIKHYIDILRRYIGYICGVMLLAGALTTYISYTYFPPEYEASVKILINSTNQSESVDADTIQANIKLINTYKEILNTSDFVKKVADKYPQLHLKPDEMEGLITISHSPETQVMSLSVSDRDQERAAQLVNAVTRVFQTEIGSYVQFKHITILGSAGSDTLSRPIYPNHLLHILTGLVVTCILSICFAMLHAAVDDSMHGEDKVAETLGLPVLAIVPKTGKKDLSHTSVSPNDQKVGEMPYATIDQKA